MSFSICHINFLFEPCIGKVTTHGTSGRSVEGGVDTEILADRAQCRRPGLTHDDDIADGLFLTAPITGYGGRTVNRGNPQIPIRDLP